MRKGNEKQFPPTLASTLFKTIKKLGKQNWWRNDFFYQQQRRPKSVLVFY